LPSWLDPVELAANHGFTAGELNAIRRLIEDHRGLIAEAASKIVSACDAGAIGLRRERFLAAARP
jgi:hypothetical protein